MKNGRVSYRNYVKHTKKIFHCTKKQDPLILKKVTLFLQVFRKKHLIDTAFMTFVLVSGAGFLNKP